MIGPTLPLRVVFENINELTLGNPKTVKTVKDLQQQMGVNCPPTEIFFGCIKYFAQKKYIEFTPLKEDPISINITDSFSIHATGITAWIDWFNLTDPNKPQFY